MTQTPYTVEGDEYEAPPPDALPVASGPTGIEPQPDDGPQPDQDPNYDDEDDRVGARVGADIITATRMLNEARSHLGFLEGARNDNPFWRWPPYSTWLRYAAYCASAMSYCMYRIGGQAGLDAIHGGHYNCAEWRDAARRTGQWRTSGERPGDMVLYDWSGTKGTPDHVGVLESSTDTTVTAIEFNTLAGTGGNQSDGGGCYRRTRNKQYVVGFVRPDWGGTSNAPKTKPDSPGDKIVLKVDGDWDGTTTRRLQQYMGLDIDGVIGLDTRKALQRLVGVTQDGAWGLGTRRALQRLVGVAQDGVWGPGTVSAFQAYLNRQGLHR